MPKKSSSHGSRLPFSFFLGLRYLKPKRTFVSVITLFSVVGVMLGIAVMIIVIAVMSGFEVEMKNKILSFESHLVVTNNGIIDDWEPLVEEIKNTPEVTGAAPFVMGPVLATFNHRVRAPKIRAVEWDQEKTVSNVEELIVDGKAELQGDTAIVGVGLAEDFGIQVGDKITLYSPGNMSQILNELDLLEQETKVDAEGKPLEQPKALDPAKLDELRQFVLPIELTVTGIFKSGRQAYDAEFVVVPLIIGQELYALGGGVHGITARSKDPYRVGVPQAALNEKLAAPLHASSWIELNAVLFNAVSNERSMMFLILFIIMIVAAFCVMNTMITVTVQKTREIGIMKAIGASTSQIVWVFLAQGMFVGVLGNAAGLTAALTLLKFRNEVTTWFAKTFNRELFPQTIYQLSGIPAHILPHDLAVICISGFVVCSLAALFPALIAASLDPVKALRYE
jgi:lipoprotein-releasing system permease protein